MGCSLTSVATVTALIAVGPAALAAAGDAIGDTLDDVLVGAPFADPSGTVSDETYLVFGNPSPPAEAELADLDGATGVTFRGFDPFDCAGIAVAGLGDVDLDGLADGQLIRTVNDVNELGQWPRTVEIGNPNVCGTPIQAIDLATCVVSNMTRVPAR